MEECRAFVFKEIQSADQVLFQWFRMAYEDEAAADGNSQRKEHIVPDKILTEEEHWALVNSD